VDRQLLWRVLRASYGRVAGLPGVAAAKARAAGLVSRAGWTAWATLETGDRLRVDFANTIGRSIWLRGAYDAPLVQFVLETLEPGDVFLDVGANVGYYTALAARKVGPEGLVIAVQPAPSVAALLLDSLAENGWTNVVLLTVAATDTPGLLRFQMETNSGWSHVASEGNRQVAGLPLDLVVAPLLQGRRLRAVKIDVEGHELEALRGMGRLLDEEAPDRVLAEAHVAQGRPWLEALFGTFVGRGYGAVDPVSGGTVTVDQVSADLWNVGFVR
jgi:FkbM family methyltransferase